MSYRQGPYTFHDTSHVPPPPNMYYTHHDGQYAAYPPPMYMPQPIYSQFGYPEMADYATLAMMGEEYEDPNETTTRPRLTKEQVDILEAQFQEHPKPNSLVKRQLAVQTKLTLPRVANWFQNRRAKAKQQRKQEEYESQNQQEAQRSAAAPQEKTAHSTTTATSTTVDDDDDEDRYTTGLESISRPPGSSTRRSSQSRPTQSPVRVQQRQFGLHDHSTRAAAQASLQRALASAQASQQEALRNQPHITYNDNIYHTTMPLQHSNPTITSAADALDSTVAMWNKPMSEWMPSQSQELQFDFGFDQQPSQSPPNSVASVAPSDSISQGYVVPQDEWEMPIATPTMPRFTTQTSDLDMHSPSTIKQMYDTTRRGSGAEALTSNFETFKFSGGSPVPPTSRAVSGAASTTSQGSDTTVDIAARRKRPRPAALTSVSLRSRSYGQLSSTSPTARSGVAVPTHSLRHAKSAGHGLSSHYAGVRKASLPSKSPLAISTFAEAEAFQQLMAEKQSEAGRTSKSNAAGPTSTSTFNLPELLQQSSAPQTTSAMVAPQLQHYSSLQSPPITPFNPDMTMQTASMVPTSTHSQYASFNDFTPPYSAGPLTSTSWSDAPLTSPDLGQFPQIPYSSYASYSALGEDSLQMPSWATPGASLDLRLGPSLDQKRAEFYHHEFPNQKEEHAEIAKKLPPSIPKNFQFSNTSVTDYGE